MKKHIQSKAGQIAIIMGIIGIVFGVGYMYQHRGQAADGSSGSKGDAISFDDKKNLAALVMAFEIATDSPAHFATPAKNSECAIDGPYPDLACTPGAVFADKTTDDICAAGYTKTVRNVNVATKRKVYAEYGIKYPQPSGSYEADHFVPLELGGSNDIANLFPEAASPTPGFHEKDIVEDYLNEQVCDGDISLPAAQALIVADWVKIYDSIPPAEVAAIKARFKNWAD